MYNLRWSTFYVFTWQHSYDILSPHYHSSFFFLVFSSFLASAHFPIFFCISFAKPGLASFSVHPCWLARYSTSRIIRLCKKACLIEATALQREKVYLKLFYVMLELESQFLANEFLLSSIYTTILFSVFFKREELLRDGRRSARNIGDSIIFGSSL